MTSAILLTPSEKDRLRRWKYSVDDQSITTEWLTPFWNYSLDWMPEHVAPNLITLAGFLCLIHAYYLTAHFSETYPSIIAILSAILIFIYQTLDALDGKQARKTKNSSPVGELFDHTCDQIGLIFLVMTVAQLMGLTDLRIQWYLINCTQLIFMDSHLQALCSGQVRFGRWTGPGEAIFAVIALLLSKVVLPNAIYNPFTQLALWLNTHPQTSEWSLVLVYALILANLAYRATTQSYSTRNGIWFCLFYRTAMTMIFYHQSTITSDLNAFDLVSDGFFWAVVTSDVVVSKMAHRELHPWIVVMAMISILDRWLVLAMGVAYYFTLYFELCQEMNISMFNTNQNVYVDGVYDLLHFGHMNQFKQALKFGNRLIVGVMGDQDAANYKRKPYQTLVERCQSVNACRIVAEVVPSAPCIVGSLTQEFLERHNIHVVACSAEYHNPENPFYEFYKVPRELGMLRVMPRTPGISTSELIRRVQADLDAVKEPGSPAESLVEPKETEQSPPESHSYEYAYETSSAEEEDSS